MCWTGKSSDRKFAFKPVVTFKLVVLKASGLFSPMYALSNFFYYKGRRCDRVELVEEPSELFQGLIDIHKGYHSYSQEKVRFSANKLKIITSIDILNADNKLIDKIITYMDINGEIREMCNKEVLVFLRCTVPQGSPYYENSDGEIVSEFLDIEESWTVNELMKYHDSRN
jgi:hypothetical protein